MVIEKFTQRFIWHTVRLKIYTAKLNHCLKLVLKITKFKKIYLCKKYWVIWKVRADFEGKLKDLNF